ncbi:hypothetical protein OROHE_012493 [Orobanche hederae]
MTIPLRHRGLPKCPNYVQFALSAGDGYVMHHITGYLKMPRRSTDDCADIPSFGRLPRRMSTSYRDTPDSVSGSHMSGSSRRPVLEDLTDQTSSKSEPQQTHATTGHIFGMPHMQHMAMQDSTYFPGYQQMPDDMAQYMQAYSSLLGRGAANATF